MTEMDDLLKLANRRIGQMVSEQEREVARRYAKVLVELKGIMAEQYEKYEKDGVLTLEDMLKHDRLKKTMKKVEFSLKTHYKDVNGDIDRILKGIYSEGHKRAAHAVETRSKAALNFNAATPEQLQAMLNNPVAGLTLNNRLEQQRGQVVYKIQQQVTSGLQQNKPYSHMAKVLKNELEGDLVKATRIVRTEGHRVQESAKHDAMEQANKGGVITMKTWRTMQDERVRRKPKGVADHKALDGKKIAQDALFNDGLSSGPAPGQLPAAASSINCRCFLTYSIERVERPQHEVLANMPLEDWEKLRYEQKKTPAEIEKMQPAKKAEPKRPEGTASTAMLAEIQKANSGVELWLAAMNNQNGIKAEFGRLTEGMNGSMSMKAATLYNELRNDPNWKPTTAKKKTDLAKPRIAPAAAAQATKPQEKANTPPAIKTPEKDKGTATKRPNKFMQFINSETFQTFHAALTAKAPADMRTPAAKKKYINELLANSDLSHMKVSIRKINAHGMVQSYSRFTKVDGQYGDQRDNFEFILNSGDKRNAAYQLKTLFHEFYHARFHGLFTDDTMYLSKADWTAWEETATETAAHFMIQEKGIQEMVVPSYSRYLMKNLPRLKRLDEFKDCKTIEDFGAVFMKYRFDDAKKTARWATLHNAVKDADKNKPFNQFKYNAEHYHQYILDNLDEALPELAAAIDESKRNDKYYRQTLLQHIQDGIKHSKHITGYDLAITWAMKKLGVK